MQGSTLIRAARVIAHLIRRPVDVWRYARNWPAWGRQPIDCELPWYSFASIDFLRSHLNRELVVFEYGAGGSTMFYAKRAKRVVCAENDREWAGRVSKALQARHLTNAHIDVMPFDPADRAAFLRSEYLNSVTRLRADVYALDGYEQGAEYRPECFRVVEKQVKRGDIIAVDDAWRYNCIREENRADRRIEFRGIGPCRYGVTSTDVYFLLVQCNIDI